MLFIGFFVFCAPIVYASTTYNHENIIEIDGYRWPNTSLRNGNLTESIRLDWEPMLKSLASGTIPDHKITWDFEDAPLYIDDSDAVVANIYFINWARFNLSTPANWPAAPRYLMASANRASIGMYDIRKIHYDTEVREIEYTDGKKGYRCALTGISIEQWRSPYGATCSYDEASKYYDRCQSKIKEIVSKVRSARQPNGEQLTNEQKLKWIHDWLVNSVEYSLAGKKMSKEEPNKVPNYDHLWNEYGAIVDGEAVCQGYAYAFKAIVDELVRQTGADIECRYVQGGGHAWNQVKLNGNWYHIDVTWDDRSTEDFLEKDISTKYFLVSDYALTGHPGGQASHNTYICPAEKSIDRRYEGMSWPRYKKDISEYGIVVNNINDICTYNSKDTTPSVAVRYGRNTLSPEFYQIETTREPITGTVKIEVVPTNNCYALNKGSKNFYFSCSVRSLIESQLNKELQHKKRQLFISLEKGW